MPIIEVSAVSKFFGSGENRVQVLHELSFSIEDGEFVAIVGPSGSGKSTLMNILGCLDKAGSGICRINGQDTADLDPDALSVLRCAHLGFVFQRYNLLSRLSALENVALPAVYAGEGKAERLQRARALLADLDLNDKLRNLPAELSGGQQQRVAIARTLAPEPSVLFMDEPLSNLDAKLRLEMRSELQRLHIDTGSTFIYVTHDQMEAMTLATKICLIDNGVLQQYDAPLDVYNKPNNLFVADFVGNPAINFMEAKGRQAPDGTVELEVFAGTRLAFTPRTPLDLPDWFARADAQDAEKKAAEQAKQSQKGHVEKGNKDTPFRCHIAKVNETEDFGDEAVLSDEDFVLGVRPEFLSISEHGALEAEVYSAMPTGMETTVKLRIGEYLLTGVIFGGVLYQIGQKVRVDFEGDHMVLFSRKNGRIITQGSLSVRSAR